MDTHDAVRTDSWLEDKYNGCMRSRGSLLWWHEAKLVWEYGVHVCGYQDGGKGSLREYGFKDITQEGYRLTRHLQLHLCSLISFEHKGYAGVQV
jgi:hypothetical protein